MKIKLVNILILFILFINIIECAVDRCIPIYSYQDSICNSNYENPQMKVSNHNLFDEILVQPDPLSTNYDEQGYIIKLDFNITYTFTFKSRFCSNPVVIQNSTGTNNMLTIQQPKCINSYAVIDLIQVNDGSKTFINNVQVDLPYEMLYNIQENKIITGMNPCSRSFYLQKPNNQGLPKFAITHSKCGQGGKVLIENASDYSSIILTDSSDSVIDSSDDGLYENLNSGSYSFTLESNQCGKQLFNIAISDIQPTYELVLLNDTCPFQPEYQFILHGQYNYELVYGGSVVSNSFKVNQYTPLLVNIDQCGSLSIPIDPIYSIPPMHYTINQLYSDTLNLCDASYSATLIYDPKLIQDFRVYIKLGSSEEDIQVKNNSFEILNHNMEYYVKSTCYSEPIKIVAPSRKPHYTILNSTQYCNELVDIKVNNYLDFTLQLLAPNGIIYLSEDGVFRKVPNQYYELQYIYRNCSETYELISIGTLNKANVYYKTNIIQYPDCRNVSDPGSVEIIFYDSFTNNKLWTSVEEFGFYDVSPLKFIIYNDIISCEEIVVNFEFKLPEPNFIVRTISKSLCNYSQRDGGGLIEVITDYPIREISINDDTRENLSAYRVKAGLNTIQIYYSGACETFHGFAYYKSEVEFSDFEISYSVASNDNCDETNGEIKVNNYNKYNKLEFNGQDILGNGQSNNLASDTYTLDFEIQLGNSSQVCSGSSNIFIPTSFDVDVQYVVKTNQYCKNAMALVDITSIKDKNGKEYVYDSTPVTVKGYEEDSEYYQFYPNIFEIKSGNCSWRKPFNITKELNESFATFELDETYVKEGISYSRYKVVYINSLVKGSAYSSYGEYLIVASNSTTDYSASFYYNDCDEHITLKPIAPVLPTIKYNIQFNGDSSCLSSHSTINISVVDYQNYSSLTYNNIPIGSNGVFSYVKPGFYIFGTLFNFDYQIKTKVIIDRPLVSNSKTVINETCYSSLNGELSINQDSSDSDYYYLLQNNDQYNSFSYESYYPVNSNQDLSSFTLLGSQDVRIIKVNKLHPSCVAYEEFTMDSNEPEIITTVSIDKCENGTIYSNLINSNLSGYYSLINGTFNYSIPSQTISPLLLELSTSSLSSSNEYIKSTNSTFTNLANGNYTVLYEIKDDICRRKFFTPVSIQVNNCTINNVKDDKLGLKIGLPIGLFFLAAFVGVGIYLYKKKLQNSKSNSVKMAKINS